MRFFEGNNMLHERQHGFKTKRSQLIEFTSQLSDYQTKCTTTDNAAQLQNYLNALEKWEGARAMQFNPIKCQHINFSKKSPYNRQILLSSQHPDPEGEAHQIPRSET